MSADCDAFVIGGGPAGAASAILLARAGWRVILAEQHVYPRRKVCGECIAAGNLELLDELGIGAAFRRSAGPDIRSVGWMDRTKTLVGDMPSCVVGRYRFGRALAREQLDTLLLERAASVGAHILQPWRVRQVRKDRGAFMIEVDTQAVRRKLRAAVVIDAHGSWEQGPIGPEGFSHAERRTHLGSDLFAFKAVYRETSLPAGFLPVLSFPGGYGGMVVGGAGRATLGACLRRDVLAECRARIPGASAGSVVEALLLSACAGVRAALAKSTREGAWLAVGPLRPGIRVDDADGIFRVGNAAGESHALIGEGISMALQGAALLAGVLSTEAPDALLNAPCRQELHRRYAAAWCAAFKTRLRLAAVFAHLAMQPRLARASRSVLERWPSLLTSAARWAGKGSNGVKLSLARAEVS